MNGATMQGYGDGTPKQSINKSGSTQPYIPGNDRNPGQGSGAVVTKGGQRTPTIVKTGATNNGGDTLPHVGGQR